MDKIIDDEDGAEDAGQKRKVELRVYSSVTLPIETTFIASGIEISEAIFKGLKEEQSIFIQE